MKTSSHSIVLALACLAAAPVFAAESTSPADRPAKVVSTVTPIYPYLMRRAEAAAEVTVTFTVNAQGKVNRASVLNSDNFEFNVSTLEAIKQWTFTPATRNGQPVEAKLQQTFLFSVHDKAAMQGTPVMVAEKKAR